MTHPKNHVALAKRYIDWCKQEPASLPMDTFCAEAERASAATSLNFTFALVAKDLLLLPIEKIT